MKRLGILLLPPEWDASPLQVTPQHSVSLPQQFSVTYFYPWVERGTARSGGGGGGGGEGGGDAKAKLFLKAMIRLRSRSDFLLKRKYVEKLEFPQGWHPCQIHLHRLESSISTDDLT